MLSATATATAPTAALHRLLEANLALPPEYADELTNHLPMALHALAVLGADDDRLHRFFEGYARRFAGRLAEPAGAPVARDWLPLRGRADGLGALRATFAARLARDGRDLLLRAVLPALWPGVAAAAFHGAIRTAHAVESGHDGELADALAYWAWRWQPLADGDPGPELAPSSWCGALRDAAQSWRAEGCLISHRMAQAAATGPYLRLAMRAAITGDLPAQLWAFAAARYAATRNFTVLHLVTGLRALHVLWPWVDDPRQALREAVKAVTAAFLAAGVPAADLAPLAARPWSDLIARAIASDDDHVIKLVHACHHAEQLRVAGPFAEAATRAVA